MLSEAFFVKESEWLECEVITTIRLQVERKCVKLCGVERQNEEVFQKSAVDQVLTEMHQCRVCSTPNNVKANCSSWASLLSGSLLLAVSLAGH